MATRHVVLDAFTQPAREALRGIEALIGPRGQAWVVGGATRDALRGRLADDLDIAVPSGALALGRELADRLGGAFVVLDERRGVCRVVGTVHVDIADFRGPDLAEDLRGRDFTVNALAVAVPDLTARGAGAVTDSTGGVADLEARQVRLCGPGALADDPVRVVRAVRLAIEPGWTLDAAVESAARSAAPALAGVSGERVRDELVAILQAAAGPGLRLLDHLGALAVILPESLPMRRTPQSGPHRFDVWEHSLRSVEAADEITGHLDQLEPWTAALRAHLEEGVGDGLTRAETLKLAALLHDVAKPDTRTEIAGRIRFIGHDAIGAERARGIADRLRLSARAGGLIARLVGQHLRPMHLAQSGGITRRARYRFFRDLGDDARDLMLLALADAAAVRGEAPLGVWAGAGGAILRSLMSGEGEAQQLAMSAPLLRGDDVMSALGLSPGPQVGRLLAELREAQALGFVSSRAEALAYLHRLAASPRTGSTDS
jgi:tRNA nucleotidyltransferase/poly(A) polymerase